MRKTTRELLDRQLEWHRGRVQALEVQLEGMSGRSLSPLRKRLLEQLRAERRTVRLLVNLRPKDE